MLRILSGTARGRAIKGLPKGLEVRPILARIRKSLFDILRPRLPGARFLDIYAGMGTVGLEALSNGAAYVVFLELERSSIKNIERNIADLGFQSQCEIRQGDATKDLRHVSARPFDIIFMGPPYKDAEKKPLALTVPTLQRLEEAGLAAPGALVICQHHDKESLAGLSDRWEQTREKIYGDSVLTFFNFKGPHAEI